MYITPAADILSTLNPEADINPDGINDFSDLFTRLLTLIESVEESGDDVSFDSRAHSDPITDDKGDVDSVIDPLENPHLTKEFPALQIVSLGTPLVPMPSWIDPGNKESERVIYHEGEQFPTGLNNVYALLPEVVQSFPLAGVTENNNITDVPLPYSVPASLLSSQLPLSADPMLSPIPLSVEGLVQASVRTPLTSPVLSQPIGTPEWQQSLSQQIQYFIREGVHHAELRLRPEVLGPIQISLRVSHEQVEMSFIAHHLQTREALDNALPALRQSLSESGLQLTESQVNEEKSDASHPFFGKDKDGEQDVMLSKMEENLPEETLLPVTGKNPLYRGVNIFV